MTPMHVLTDTTETRAAMIAVCLAMNEQGINQGTAGNVSVRVDGAMLITPSGIPYGDMTPDMMVRVPLDTEPDASGALKPSSEWRFHQALLNARPDMPVVLHAHPVQATAVAIQRLTIPAVHYMIAAFGGHDIPLAGYATFGTDALSRNVVAAMQDRHGCIMANHGATVLGESLDRALWRMAELEMLAHLFTITRASGSPVILSRAEIDAALDAFADYGPRDTS